MADREGVDVDEGIARIELRRKSGPSLWGVVDLEDYERVSQYRWYALNGKHTHYVVHGTCDPETGRKGTLYLHRFLLGAPPNLDVDHVDHDGLNNRRSNLRLATQSQNLGNARNIRGGSSQYKGVTWAKAEGCWKAQIRVNNRNVGLGRFAVEEEAARAYDAAALAAWGEFAYINFPEDLAA